MAELGQAQRAPVTTPFTISSAALRVGRARLALLAWLAARKGGGRFLLRRHNAAGTDDLAWLGLDWIEPPQPERGAAHAAAVEQLRTAGRLYPCFEGEDELNRKRELRLRRGQKPIYDRAMLKMTDAQRAAAEAGGKRPYWRFRLSDTTIRWQDRVAGRPSVDLPDVSDPVLVQADGTLAPALAGALDDIADGVTLLVRDADQVEDSAVHLDLLAALGADPGRLVLAHVPPLPADLAATPLRRLRQDGVLPSALATLLVRPDAAPMSAADLADGFDWRAVGTGDVARLRALNRAALADLPFAAVAQALPAGADAAFWDAIRGGIDLLSEAKLWWDVVAGPFVPPVVDRRLLARALETFPGGPLDDTTWPHWAAAVGDAEALRFVLTGEEAGPDMARLLPLIGPDQARRRLGGG